MGKAELRVAAGYVLTELGRALREAGSDPDNYVQRVKKLEGDVRGVEFPERRRR